MATGEACKPVDLDIITLIPADLPGYQRWSARKLLSQSADGVGRNLRQIRVAAREEIWSGLPDQILESFSRDERHSQSDAQSHPACVPFPDLAPPDERPGRAPEGGGTGDKEEGEDHHERCGSHQGDQHQGSSRHGFMEIVRIGNA